MIKLRFTEYMLLLYICLIPLENILIFDAFGTITKVIGFILAITFVFEYRINLSIISAYAYFFIVILVLSTFTADLGEPYQALRIFMLFVSMIIVTHVFKANITLFYISMNLYSILALLLAIITFIGFMSNMERYALEGFDLAPLSLILVIACSFQFYFFSTQKVTWPNSLTLVGLLLGIIATGTRAAMLATLVMSVVFIFRSTLISKILKRIAYTVLLFITFLFVFPETFNFISQRIAFTKEDKGANRTAIWKTGFEMWQDKPFFGYGYRNFPNYFTQKYINNANLSSEDYTRLVQGGEGLNRGAHNDFINVFVELGIVGFTFFILWFITILKNYKYLFPYIYIFIGLIVVSLFQDNINLKSFWLVLGIMELAKSKIPYSKKFVSNKLLYTNSLISYNKV